MDAFDQFSAEVGAALAVLAILLIILWIALPFAVFGIKPLLKRLIVQNEVIISGLQKSTNPTRASPPDEGDKPKDVGFTQ